jgi:hypothetical protein
MMTAREKVFLFKIPIIPGLLGEVPIAISSLVLFFADLDGSTRRIQAPPRPLVWVATD